jgi:cysteine desulfurase
MTLSNDEDAIEDNQEDAPFPLYFDSQATTPTDPRVLDKMMPFLTNNYGNPHSKSHQFGWDTELACE